MYELLVYYVDELRPRARADVNRATDVLIRIPQLLGEHTSCHRVEVIFNGVRLFAVDCVGNRLP